MNCQKLLANNKLDDELEKDWRKVVNSEREFSLAYIFGILIFVIVKTFTVFVGSTMVAIVFLRSQNLETVEQLLEDIPILAEVVELIEVIIPEPIMEATSVDPAGEAVLETPIDWSGYDDPAGCAQPQGGYDLITLEPWVVSERTYSMLIRAEEIFSDEVDLTGEALILGSYDGRSELQETVFSGGGAIGLSVLNPETASTFDIDVGLLIDSLRKAGFAAWLRGVDELFAGSPIMIEAIAIGDRDLNLVADAKLFSEHGYFAGNNGMSGTTSPDGYGGPVVCRWMLEAGLGGTQPISAAEEVGSTFETEGHHGFFETINGIENSGRMAIVHEALHFELSGYEGPESFICMAPSDLAVLAGRYGDQRGDFVHAGIDYAQCSRTGFGVYTPFGGQVTFAGYHELFGNLVLIENYNWQVLLAHNLVNLVQEGAIVKAGQMVALSGSSGNSGGPHIHMEFRYCEGGKNCRPMDPSLILLPGQPDYCDWESLGQRECP